MRTCSLSYTYLPGSYVQFGFTQDRCDRLTGAESQPGIIQYQETRSFTDMNHHITAKLIGSRSLAVFSIPTYHGAASIADPM